MNKRQRKKHFKKLWDKKLAKLADAYFAEQFAMGRSFEWVKPEWRK